MSVGELGRYDWKWTDTSARQMDTETVQDPHSKTYVGQEIQPGTKNKTYERRKTVRNWISCLNRVHEPIRKL
ncbi:hypothetical protein PISMIDRAFT_678565 [Pisolithus microcarpus 441]|uniref:Uncharacterized protein n=1 Tax=Pisolithus microcarpus 441 TaxID=765257 RepID=A0A0C9YGM0_9AGAM|nr:hypothetical protein PISMIDRAFT_678565 [Pisolithus microcarpus 441]